MAIQLLIITIYFLITISIGMVAKRKSVSSDCFHGVGLGVLMCVTIGAGEWLGGTSTTGVAEYGYSYGLSGAWFTIANGIGISVLALFFAKLYRSLETVTVPGIIEKFIGVDARIVSSILLTFVMIAVGTAQVIAAAMLGVSVLGLDFNVSVIILGTGFIIYTLAGGMMAISYTSIIHLIAMYGGIILSLSFAVGDIGGMSVLRETLPESYFSWTNIGMSRVSSWIIASILGACTAQAAIQPILVAKDVNVAKRAAIITSLVVGPFGILTALLGMTAKVKFPDLANAKLALPTLMMSQQPIVGGIVLSAILAAILSTVSPVILACGTMITKDIYQRKLKPEATDQEILKVSRIVTGISGIVCVFIALLMYGSTTILDMMYFAYTIRGSLFVVLLFAIYWKKTSTRGAIAAMLITTAVGFIWVSYKSIYGQFPIHPNLTETYISVMVACVSTVVLSLLFPNKTLKESELGEN
ncbi:solute:Na+ symporter, SSS family [Anaerovirgula multivorans]|uniref:Solute:Na+ symporter, SSS family n=1 Tax=Anaerovirgula multivorans TaxID=312168 RepID=A0A239G2P0_9FIRM|nr:sodium:solute symporter family protein [Anaerovirgula multivorans]SNS62832.1 solute:Na+ symporter, SSS family [Anaerovirgula multivorans]